jgi:hypothetical protein
MPMTRTKKPSRLKQLNQLFVEKMKHRLIQENKERLNKSFVTENSDEEKI